MSRLLTARDVAEQLGVSAETVLRWTRRRELPAIRLPGGAIRYREHELERWIEERATLRRGDLPTNPVERRPDGTLALSSKAPTSPSSDEETM